MQVIPEFIGGFLLVLAFIGLFILAVRADGGLGWGTLGLRVNNPDPTDDDDESSDTGTDKAETKSSNTEIDTADTKISDTETVKAEAIQNVQYGSGGSTTIVKDVTHIPSSETQLSKSVSTENYTIDSGSTRIVSPESGSNKSNSNSPESASNKSNSTSPESGGNKTVSPVSYSNYHTSSETSHHKIITNMADLQKVFPDVQPLLRDVQTFAPIIEKLLDLSDGVNTKINDFTSLGSDIANFLVSVKSQFNNVSTGGKVDFAALNSTLDRLKRQVDEMMPE